MPSDVKMGSNSLGLVRQAPAFPCTPDVNFFADPSNNHVDHSSPAGEPIQINQLRLPVLLMNLPLSLSTRIPNNVWMMQMQPSEREICMGRALAQFFELYQHLSQLGFIYLLPTKPGLQDQTYVSNLGVVLHHCATDTVIISRFRSEPRIEEAGVGIEFFRLMNFTVEQPPPTDGLNPIFFEGEADLKHIRDNLYIGAHGMRTSRNALDWAADRFGMTILPFEMSNSYLFHLDCCLFSISSDAVILCTSLANKETLSQIEKHCEIVDISLDEALSGITNNVLLGGEVICDSNISELKAGSEKYDREKAKVDRLENLCDRYNLRLKVFCMSEFYKSGALLSCMVLPINKREYV